MKTIYSLKEFYNEVMALAAQKSTDYVCVRTTMTTRSKIQFECYFDGCEKYYVGNTPGEAIKNMKDAEFPRPEKNQDDVEIEHESEPEH